MFKLLYVLTSTEKDIYLEQTLISIFSARIYMPNINITLLTDDKTNNSLIRGRARIKDFVTEIIVTEVPENLTSMQISRFLKTSMRMHVQGDFLYIDGDTVLCESLEEIATFPSDIGMVLDSNSDHDIKHYFSRYKHKIYSYFKKNAGNLPQRYKFFNSGVIWCKDTEAGYKFFDEWHENWKKSYNHGIFVDQIALNLTNLDKDIVQELDGKYNCQIEHCAKYLSSAKILHYFATNSFFKYEPFATELAMQLKANDFFVENYREIIANPTKFFPTPSLIIANSDLEIYKSELGRLMKRIVKLFYKCKPLFTRLNDVFYLLRVTIRERNK
ncbi:MAG: hypothetical protein LBI42_15405 [Chitinispirillales bacterium]|jgi:hypothetical protein|nr:hypothetical protein [Chitinispirillales bacterium]